MSEQSSDKHSHKGRHHKWKQGKHRVYAHHYDKHSDKLHGIYYYDRKSVNEKPINSVGVVIDLVHKSAGGAGGEKADRQSFYGFKDSLFYIVDDQCGYFRAYYIVYNVNTEEFNKLPAENGTYEFINVIYNEKSNSMKIIEYQIEYYVKGNDIK